MATYPPYDIEFRSKVDDAWYSSRIVFSDNDNNLVVKLHNFPDTNDEVFSLSEFPTVADVDNFVCRFRRISEQLQDAECGRVREGMRVCASYAFRVDDIRYYDAIVDTVVPKEHLSGKEECNCRFLLHWQHGKNKDLVSRASIANICIVEPTDEIDSRVASFAKMAKEKIERSGVGKSSSPEHRNVLSSAKQCSNSSQVKQEIEQSPTPLGRKEEAGRLSKYYENNIQDMDFTIAGRISQRSENNLPDIRGSFSSGKGISSSSVGEKTRTYCTLSWGGVQVKEENGRRLVDSSGGKEGSLLLPNAPDGAPTSASPLLLLLPSPLPLGATKGSTCREEPEIHHFVLVDNLEKDLSSSSMMKFIQKHTSISPQACVFPSLSSELYTRGVIEIDSEKKLKQICKFLNNPDQIVTSFKGRPWVIHEEPPKCKTVEPIIRGVSSKLQGQCQEKIVEQLKVVHRGDQDYMTVRRKRDLFLDFVEHQKVLHKKLALEEKKI